MNLTQNKLGVIIKKLKILENKDAFKKIKINSQTYKIQPISIRYIKKEVPNLILKRFGKRIGQK